MTVNGTSTYGKGSNSVQMRHYNERVVLDAMRAYYERDNANPHRGAYDLSVRSTERYHAARERIARFLGAAATSTFAKAIAGLGGS